MEHQQNLPVEENETTGSQSNGSLFADLLDQYEPTPLRRGQLVEGEILQLQDNVVFVNVGAKRTAVIPPQDLERVDEAILANLSPGDEVLLYVLRTPVGDDDLLVSLQKGLEQQDWVEAHSYLANEEMLELEVVGHNKGGLVVAFGNLHGFIPNSHVPQLKHIRDRGEMVSYKARMVGDELPLKVIEVDRDRRRLVLSARAAQRAFRAQRFAELKQQEGETLTGRVTSLVKFGAFVDLGGVEGLVHMSEIAWQQVTEAADHLAVGDEIAVKLLTVDVERERIGLSRKALLPNPWHAFEAAHAPGELLEGVVTNVAEFGAFVRVADGIEGLVHVSEMHGARGQDPRELLVAGDTVLVRIVRIEPERERLGLSQRRVSREEEMAWIWQQAAEQEPEAAPEPAAEDEAPLMEAELIAA